MLFVPASQGGHCPPLLIVHIVEKHGGRCPPYGSLAGWPESIAHRACPGLDPGVRSYSPSSATIASRIRYFCTLPVTVIGNASTKRT